MVLATASRVFSLIVKARLYLMNSRSVFISRLSEDQ